VVAGVSLIMRMWWVQCSCSQLEPAGNVHSRFTLPLLQWRMQVSLLNQ
jgi:hypothetical protein